MKLLPLISLVAASLVPAAAQARDWPSGYSKCADEGGQCKAGPVARKVSYGIKEYWVTKTASGNVPAAAHVHREIGSVYELLFACAHQGVRWENPHQNANAENVVGVEAATVRGDGLVIEHRRF